jgi:DNA replication protein DnaC
MTKNKTNKQTSNNGAGGNGARRSAEDIALRERAFRLGMHGLLAHWDEVAAAPWLPQLLDYEEAERTRRSLERRIRNARLGSFKPLIDFDWSWPNKIDREAIDEVLSLGFFEEGVNTLLLGPNGVGKTLLLKNLAHHALLRGYTVRFITASDMLNDLAVPDTSVALTRRLSRYCRPQLLCVDEVGYLSYDSRYADLLFEVVTRRYEAQKPIAISTNKPFAQWSEVFPNAACVVTLIDRLIHRCELIDIQARSYRLKEAKERAANKKKRAASSKKTKTTSSRSGRT